MSINNKLSHNNSNNGKYFIRSSKCLIFLVEQWVAWMYVGDKKYEEAYDMINFWKWTTIAIHLGAF